MGLRLVSFNDMYVDDVDRIVQPFWATRKIQDACESSRTIIWGLERHVSPFGDKAMQVASLIRKIESGSILLLDDSKWFGTGGQRLAGNDDFLSHVETVRSSGKVKPQYSISYIEPTEKEPEPKEVPPPPVPVVKQEQQEKTEFLCGWAECQKFQPKEDAIAALFPAKYKEEKKALTLRHNDHLKSEVREGEVIVLTTRDPKTEEETAKLNKIKAEAAKVTSAIHSVSKEKAEIAVRYFPLLDYLGTKDFYNTPSDTPTTPDEEQSFSEYVGTTKFYQDSLTISGSVVSAYEKFLESVKSSLEAINQLFIDEVISVGSTRLLSKAFYAQRAKLFSQLDSVLHRMTFNCVGIPVYGKLKHTLGLSVKSMAHHGKDLVEVDGVLKQLAPRMTAITGWLSKTKGLGILGVVLDSLTSVPVIVEAFTSENGKPIKTTAAQAARVAGGVLGGMIGVKFGTAIVSLGIKGAGAVGLGVAGSPVILGVALIAVVGTTAYFGADYLSSTLEEKAKEIYEYYEEGFTKEYIEPEVYQSGGFFNWNAEQI